MKYLYVCLIALSLVTFGCEKEAIGPETNEPVAQLAGNNRIPSYTMAEMDALLMEQQDEAAFMKKIEIAAYVLTRWLGEHAGSIGLTGGGTLNGVLPCDQGWLGDGGILRVLGQATGIGEAGVAMQMSAYVETCVKGCTLPPTAAQNLVYTLLGSLVHEGQQYDLRNHYVSFPNGNQPRIFVSHGVGMRPQGLRALGFQVQLNSGALTYEEKTLSDAMNQGMLLLDAREVTPEPGTLRFVNPCGGGNVYGGNNGGGGSGGSGGGSGGSSNLDDDGANKNGFTGGLVTELTGIDSYGCSRPTGVRVTQMHLSRRAEGGLFSGKSEVYVDVTIYRSADPAATWKTNDGSPKMVHVTLNSVPLFFNVGKQLAQVPANEISSSWPYTITPTSAYLPNNNSDWVLLEEGFCDLAGSPGYDRMYVTLFENDPFVAGLAVSQWFLPISTAPAILVEGYHYAEMTLSSDKYFSVEITPSMFGVGSNAVYLAGENGVFYTSQTTPSTTASWIRLELF